MNTNTGEKELIGRWQHYLWKMKCTEQNNNNNMIKKIKLNQKQWIPIEDRIEQEYNYVFYCEKVGPFRI